MAHEVTVPRLGWSMEEGTFAAWLKRPGDRVQAGELLFCLESEKATQDIEAIDSGLLHLPPDAPKPGDPVKVGQLLAYLLAEGEIFESAAGLPVSSGGSTSLEPATRAASSPGDNPATLRAGAGSGARAGSDIDRVATPRARRVSRELGVDWTALSGSGAGGRIREVDVRDAAASEVTTGKVAPASAASIATAATRRVIAERMRLSAQNTVPVTLHTIADASSLVRLREGWKREGRALVPSYTDMMMVLIARTLTAHPALNACWEAEHLVVSPKVHLGLAVDTDVGLTVPVIQNVGELSLRQVAERSRDLIQRTRSRQATAEELRGGTFTLTNLGAYGIDAFTPVINYPQVAILGMGCIRRQLVIEGESMVMRDMISLSLTFDHQAVDGAPAARFLQALTERVRAADGLE